jgi:hypothetical protein
MMRPILTMRRLLWTPAVAAVLVAGSALRVVGDGSDYIGAALNFVDGRGAAMTAGEAAALHARFAAARRAARFLNILLYVLAWRALAARAGWQMQVLLFAGPIVWWLDKAHTEVFTGAAAIALFDSSEGTIAVLTDIRSGAAVEASSAGLRVAFVNAESGEAMSALSQSDGQRIPVPRGAELVVVTAGR